MYDRETLVFAFSLFPRLIHLPMGLLFRVVAIDQITMSSLLIVGHCYLCWKLQSIHQVCARQPIGCCPQQTTSFWLYIHFPLLLQYRGTSCLSFSLDPMIPDYTA